MLKLVATLTHEGDRVDLPANPTANLSQISQRTLQVKRCWSKIRGKQLVGEDIRSHAATLRLTLEPVVRVGSHMDGACSRSHGANCRRSDGAPGAFWPSARPVLQLAKNGFTPLVQVCGGLCG